MQVGAFLPVGSVGAAVAAVVVGVLSDAVRQRRTLMILSLLMALSRVTLIGSKHLLILTAAAFFGNLSGFVGDGGHQPVSTPVLPLVTDLGPGETAVLALALESPDAVVILDDALARQVATALAIPFRGTLGVLLDAKRAGLVSTILPLLDQLQVLRFRLSVRTREVILALAGETS